MPPRDPELPEGTDHIVSGAGETNRGRATAGPGGGGTAGTTGTQRGSKSAGGTQGGFVASAGGNDTGGTARSAGEGSGSVREKIKEQAVGLKDQAADKLRGVADDGKSRATGVLGEFCGVIEDAAKSIDERLGPEYGEYAHKAADYVSDWNARFRDKSVDELLEDTRSMVRASPGVAIAAAAVAGFALMRVVRSGLQDLGAESTGTSRSTTGSEGAAGATATSGTASTTGTAGTTGTTGTRA